MIPVHNIYYMLSYVYNCLQEDEYKDLEIEKFSNALDLYSALLEKGIKKQLKRGLERSYVNATDSLPTVHGKLNISETLKNQMALKKQIVCEYDELSVNTEMNRILKTMILLLLRTDIDIERKMAFRSLIKYFSEVDEIQLNTVNWQHCYHRNNQTYQMLMGICYLIYEGYLHTQKTGQKRLKDYLDLQAPHRLYEKFILAYYKKEHQEINASAMKISWQTDDGNEALLPKMQTDITLASRDGSKVLIIDAKYYEKHMLQERDGVFSQHSHNLYQIFTYVKNKEYELREEKHIVSGSVSGLLLYGKTDEKINPNQNYKMTGNRISVRALDLNLPFQDIRKQLDDIIIEFGLVDEELN